VAKIMEVKVFDAQGDACAPKRCASSVWFAWKDPLMLFGRLAIDQGPHVSEQREALVVSLFLSRMLCIPEYGRSRWRI